METVQFAEGRVKLAWDFELATIIGCELEVGEDLFVKSDGATAYNMFNFCKMVTEQKREFPPAIELVLPDTPENKDLRQKMAWPPFPAKMPIPPFQFIFPPSVCFLSLEIAKDLFENFSTLFEQIKTSKAA